MIKNLGGGLNVKDTGISEISTPTIADLLTRIQNDANIDASYKNLVIKTNDTTPNNKVDITADEAVIQDSDGNNIKLSNVSITLDITVSGAGGLDTGFEAFPEWYFIWLIYDGTTINGIFSISSTAPTIPAGYTHKALFGVVRNASGGDFLKFLQLDNNFFYNDPIDIGGGTDASETGIATASTVPTVAKGVHAENRHEGSVTGSNKVYTKYDSLGEYGRLSGYGIGTFDGANAGLLPMLPSGDRNIYYINVSCDTTVFVRGFVI